MLILAGLGNPGAKYEKNRHNIGFMAVDEIARRWSFGPWRTRFQGVACEGSIPAADGPVKALILKPQTWMNESGRSVGEALKFFKLAPADLVVFHDELDLAPGRFRMKLGGGVAGHNGLKDISAVLGSPNFWRLRLGIGHPGDRNLVGDYVLSSPAPSERELIEKAMDKSLDCLPAVLAGDMEAGMLKLHTKSPPPAGADIGKTEKKAEKP